MRRGSIQTFESLARRQSANMAQFASNRSEFMTSDAGLSDIEYERKGGFFMSHKKTALVVSVVVVIVIAAGFVGAYIGSNPKEKIYDTLALIEDDIGCENRASSSKFSLADAIRPSRYRIELTPVLEEDPIARLWGRVVVEFRHNGSASLQAIVINARKIEVSRAELIKVSSATSDHSVKSRRRRNSTAQETAVDGNGTPVSDFGEVDGTNSTLENRTIGNETVTDDLSKNYAISNDDPANSASEDDPHKSTDTHLSMTSSDDVPNFEKTDNNETAEIAISRIEVDDDGGFVVFHPASPVKSGNYVLEIDYEVPLDGYEVLTTNSSRNNSTQKLTSGRLNPTNIRDFFPLFDDPRMKARFSLSMPRTMSMIIHSNMPVENVTTISDDWVLVTFEETPPIAPENLVVVETTPVEKLGDQATNETSIVVMGDKLRQGPADYVVETIGPVIGALVDLFGLNLPIQQLNIIGVDNPDHSYGHLGLVTIKDSFYKVTEKSPKVTREEVTTSLVKLFGQQWLGGLVNVRNSTDNWILESSLLYLQHYLKIEIDPNFHGSTFFTDVQSIAMEVDGYSVSRSLKSKLSPTHSNSFYIHEVYAMGACLIRMLHGALRQSEFRDGYRSFVSRWNGKNSDAAEFWNAMTLNSTDDEKPKVEVGLPEVMRLWAKEGGYPVVTVKRNYETGSAIVHQTRFSYDKPSSPTQQLWHIPLTWITQNQTNETSESAIKWMKPQVEITLENISQPGDNESWIVFNPTKSGYYRVNYDENNWNLIARGLRDDHQSFEPETRASIVDDAFGLAFVGLLPYSIVFEVIDYMTTNETEPEPWSVLLHHTLKLNLALYDSPVYASYQEYMIKFLSDLYNRVGSEIMDGTRLTRIAHRLACLFDYTDFVDWAKKSYGGSKNSSGLPINENVPFYLHDNLLCAFAKFEHELGWQWWQQKFTNVTNAEERITLLTSLACFQVPWMLQAVLNDIVYGTSFDESDALVILESFSNYPAASQTALQFVESNWKNITRRYPKSCKIASAFLDASSTGFTSEKDLEDFQSFKIKNYESLKKVGYVTALLESKANACVSFLKTSHDEIHTSIANRTTSPSPMDDEKKVHP